MYYLGIDLGGMSIKAGICDDNGKILCKDTCVTVRNEDGDRIINDMANLCLKVISDAGLTVNDIEYAGIASPGSADSEKGVIIYAATLPFLNSFLFNFHSLILCKLARDFYLNFL